MTGREGGRLRGGQSVVFLTCEAEEPEMRQRGGASLPAFLRLAGTGSASHAGKAKGCATSVRRRARRSE